METVLNEKGLALIVAVVMMILFAVIAALMVSLVSGDSDMALYQFRSSEATYIANAGMQHAMLFYNARQGTGTVSSAGTTVTGAGTLFTTEPQVGSKITANNQTRTITAIASATSLTVDAAFAPALVAGTPYVYAPRYPNFSIPPNSTRGATPQVVLGSGGFTIDPAGVVSAAIGNATSPIPAICFDQGVTVGCNTIFPATGRILIENELISYTGVAANSFTGVARGVGRSQAAAHAINAGIHHATALTAAVNNVVTTIPVASTVGFIIPGTIKIDQEYLYCTGTAGGFSGCTRGAQGSQAVAHTAFATAVQLTVTVNATVPTGIAGNAQRVIKGESSVYLDGWVVGRDDVGGAPAMLRWNGMNWDNVAIPANATERLMSVSMIDTDNDGDADEGFAVGRRGGAAPCNNALIMRWNGTGWNCVASPSDQDLNAVFMLSAVEGWAVGENGGCTGADPTIIRWNGVSWTCAPGLGPLPNLDVNGIYMVSSTDGWGVGDDPGGGGGARAIVLRWNIPCGGGAGTGLWNNCSTAAFIPAIDENLRDVFMVSANDGWAVGDNNGCSGGDPTIIRWNGIRWNCAPGLGGLSNEDLNSVSMVSATDGWAVGDSNNVRPVIFRFNIPCQGGAPTGVWNDCTNIAGFIPAVDENLISVHMVSPTEGWAVGDADGAGGVILHWNGTNWSRYVSPNANRFTDVFMVSPKNFMRIGDWQEVY